MSTAKLGFKAVLYLVAGTTESPTYTAITAVSDMQVPATRAQLEASSRDGEINEFEPGKMDLGITGKFRSDPAAPGFTAFEGSFFDINQKIRLLVLDAEKTKEGARGFCMDFKNFTWTEDQSLGTVIYKEFELKPCVSSYKKKAVVSVSGETTTLTLTDI